MMDILLGLPQEVQGKPEGAPLPHSRQGTDSLDSVLKKLGRVFFRYCHAWLVWVW